MIFIGGVFLSCLILLVTPFLDNNKFRHLAAFLSIFIYSYLIAVKGESGSDTFLYVDLFQKHGSTLTFSFIEPGIIWFFQGINQITSEYYIVNFFHSVLVGFSLWLLYKNKDPYVLVVYIIYIGINVDFSTLRQSISFHCFVLMWFLLKNQLIASLLASVFHVSAIFSYAYNLTNMKFRAPLIILAGGLCVFIYYFFLIRYLEVGRDFIFRSDAVFFLQSLFLVLLLYLMGYKKKILFVIFILSAIPIGFRLVFFYLVFCPSPLPNRLSNKLFLGFLLIVFLSVKLQSFTAQSIENDGERSTIRHFDIR